MAGLFNSGAAGMALQKQKGTGGLPGGLLVDRLQARRKPAPQTEAEAARSAAAQQQGYRNAFKQRLAQFNPSAATRDLVS